MGDKASSSISMLEEMVAQRRFQDAVKMARLTLLGAPQDIESRLLLAKSLMSLARYDDVLAEVQIALELDDSRSDAWTLKGEALFFKGSFGKALKSLTMAQSLGAKNKKVKRLIDEIRMTQDPELDGGSAIADTAATKSYPMEETGEVDEDSEEADPTEIMDISDMESFPEEENDIAESKAEIESAGDLGSALEADAVDGRIEGKSVDLLAVGDSTSMDEYPPGFFAEQEDDVTDPAEIVEDSCKDEMKKAGGLRNETKELDIGDLEVIEGSTESTAAENVKNSVEPLFAENKESREDKADVFGNRKRQRTAKNAGKAALEEVNCYEEEEEETDARGAVVKFISPEKLVTVEQVAVTTGEIDGLPATTAGKRAEEALIISSIETEEEEKTLSLKPVSGTGQSSRQRLEQRQVGSSLPLSDHKEGLKEKKSIDRAEKARAKSRLPAPVKKQRGLPRVLSLSDVGEDTEELTTKPHLSEKKLPSMEPEPARRPILKEDPFAEQRIHQPKPFPTVPAPGSPGLRNGRPEVRKQDARLIGATGGVGDQPHVGGPPRPPAGGPPRPPAGGPLRPPAGGPLRPPAGGPPRPPAGGAPRPLLSGQRPGTPAPYSGRGGVVPEMRQTADVGRKTPVGVSRTPLTPGRPLTGTKALLSVKKVWKSPIWVGAGLVVVVLAVAVTSGLLYVRSRSEKREREQKEKAFSLMLRGDMEGLRGASLIFEKFPNDTDAQAARALALILLSVEFGHSAETAKTAVTDVRSVQSEFGAAAKIGKLVLRGNIKSALDVADEAVGKWSGSSWIFYMRGLALTANGSWEAGANNLRHALRLKNPPTVWINFLLARLWLTAENSDDANVPIKVLKAKLSGSSAVELLDVRLHLLKCREKRGCPCAELKKHILRLGQNAVQAWPPFHKAWAHLVKTKIHLCLRDQDGAEAGIGVLREERDFQQVDFQEAVAEVLLSMQRQNEAVDKLTMIKEKYPSRPKTRLLLARAYLESDQPQKSLDELATVESRSRGTGWHGIHAEALLRMGRNSDALSAVEAGLRAAPENLSLQITRMKILEALGRSVYAYKLARKLFEENPQNIEVLFAGGEVLEKQGKLVLAEARLKAALEHDGNNPGVHAALGRVLVRRGEWERAQTHLKRAASIQPSSLANWLEIGELTFQLGRFEAARSPFEQVLKRSPNNPGAMVRMARINVLTGDFQEAYKILRRVSEKERDEMWNLVNGWANLREGNYAEADSYLQKAGEESEALLIKATALSAMSAVYQLQYRKAERLLSRLDGRSSRHPLILMTRGRIFLARRKVRAALKLFNAAWQACNNTNCFPRLAAQIRAYRGRTYFLMGTGRTAYREFNSALEIDPYCAIAYHLHGACLYEEEKESLSYQMLTKGLSFDRGYAETHYYLGEIYRNKGQRNKAAEHFRTYLRYRRYGELVSAARTSLSEVD